MKMERRKAAKVGGTRQKKQQKQCFVQSGMLQLAKVGGAYKRKWLCANQRHLDWLCCAVNDGVARGGQGGWNKSCSLCMETASLKFENVLR